MDERIFILARMDNTREALRLITDENYDIHKAVEFCKVTFSRYFCPTKHFLLIVFMYHLTVLRLKIDFVEFLAFLTNLIHLVKECLLPEF